MLVWVGVGGWVCVCVGVWVGGWVFFAGAQYFVHFPRV